LTLTALPRKLDGDVCVGSASGSLEFALVSIVDPVASTYWTRGGVISIAGAFIRTDAAGIAAIRGDHTSCPKTALLVSTRIALLTFPSVFNPGVKASFARCHTKLTVISVGLSISSTDMVDLLLAVGRTLAEGTTIRACHTLGPPSAKCFLAGFYKEIVLVLALVTCKGELVSLVCAFLITTNKNTIA
jgi:hypothetical protein